MPRILLLILLLALAACKKDDVKPELPPETATGAMTFGCKIDGHVFLPRDGRGQPGLNIQYMNLEPGPGYLLGISAVDWKPIDALRITMDSVWLEEGQTYPFTTARHGVRAEFNAEIYFEKLNQDSGELTITHLDRAQRILAGRFHFVGTNQVTGQQVRVTEGRFDLRF